MRSQRQPSIVFLYSILEHTTILENGTAVFVSTAHGSDTATGGPNHPVKTLHRAFAIAKLRTPFSDLYIEAGEYQDRRTLVLEDHMSVYGGFDATRLLSPFSLVWTRTSRDCLHPTG